MKAALYNETQYVTPDKITLHVHTWTPSDQPVRAQLLLIHGYMEHAARYREFAHHLAEMGIETVAPDMRGHGKSDGKRGYVAVYNDYLQDIQHIYQTLTHPNKFMLGHSNGGLATLAFTQQYQPNLRGIILSNPYLGMAFKPPKIATLIAAFASKFWPTLNLPANVQPEMLTHDTEMQAIHSRDRLVFRTANASWFRESNRMHEHILNHPNISVPTLFIYSDSDPVASPQASKEFLEKLQCPDLHVILRQGEAHEVLNEVNRLSLFDDIARWIKNHSVSNNASSTG